MQTKDLELGYFAHPDEGGPHPGVVLIPDVWGLSDHYRDLARRLAGDGFGVLALDIYRRLTEVSISEPGPWMRNLSDPQMLDDVRAALELLRGDPATAGRKLGITGFCMGGMYALLAACECEGLSASAPFYGLLSHEHGILHDESGLDPAKKPRQPLDAVADLRCPLLAFYGDGDQFVPMSDIEALRERLAATPHETEVVVYPGAGHAFVNETRPDAFRPEATQDAWRRMVAFFRRHLA